MSENILVELLTPEGQPAGAGEAGEVVVTDLNNHTMPLVRYRLGDFAIRAEGCACGRGFPAIEKIWGREYDSVESPDGRKYHGEFFMYLFEDLRSAGLGVDQFQVVQTGPRALQVYVVSGKRVSNDTVARIEQHLTSRLQGMTAEVTQVPSIKRAASGKMRLVRNDWGTQHAG